MTLAARDLLDAVGGELVAGTLDGVELDDVTRDSRGAGPRVAFVAVRGTTRDGVAYARDAVGAGASVVVVERDAIETMGELRRADETRVPVIAVDDARVALARAAHRVSGDPTRELDVVGITGTNGKTTTSYLVEGVIAGCGGSVARMGTIAYALPGEPPTPAPLTTPESDAIARFARAARDRGATHLVMEVSSHALSMARVEAVHFACAVFTNLTQDHLDYHATMDAYEAAKRRLFVEHEPRTAAIHVDDPVGRRFATASRAKRVVTFGREAEDADVRATSVHFDRDGLVAAVRFPDREREVRSPFVGAHNLENVLAALSVAVALELDLDRAVAGIARVAGVPGRLERVAHPAGALVVVDYAHTPDALSRALAALRPITPRRLFCVFGCGGDRDRGKRPLMGEAVVRGADVGIVTDDNPRTERREDIHAAIVEGVARAGARRIEPDALASAEHSTFTVVPDRDRAIAAAVRAAGDGDTVLLAGKGHEDYQIVGTTKRPFDDRLEALRAVGLAPAVGA